jgi:hypothetical protein
MAQALNSEYEWGVDNANQGNLSAAQVLGLGSLAPQSGIGLLGAQPAPATLNPYSQLPTPNFAPGAASDFNFEVPELQTIAAGEGGGVGGASPLDFATGIANVGNSATPPGSDNPQPYFDPNYPYESMLALKNWLSPQVAAGVAPAENARGLDYSGVGAYGEASAQNDLDQLTPMGETGQQALGNDMDYLYGPNIANSLIEGTASRPGDVISSLPASLAPGATPFGNGSTDAQAVLLDNPNYNPAAGQPADQQPTYWLSPPRNEIGVTDPSLTPVPGWTELNAPPASSPVPGQPQFGLYDLASGTQYETPGYWYNPVKPPDTAQMPWLQNATPYSGS